MAVRGRGDGGNFLRTVDGAGLGGLGDADGGRLRMMHDAIDRLGQRFGELARVDLARGAADRAELGARREELRRIGLVDQDVRGRMAEDGAPRRRAAGQRQHVGRGAGGDREGHQVGPLEEVAQPLLDLMCPGVGAVGRRRAARKGTAHGLDDGGMGADFVVAAKVHSFSSRWCVTASMRLPSGSRTNAA